MALSCEPLSVFWGLLSLILVLHSDCRSLKEILNALFYLYVCAYNIKFRGHAATLGGSIFELGQWHSIIHIKRILHHLFEFILCRTNNRPFFNLFPCQELHAC